MGLFRRINLWLGAEAKPSEAAHAERVWDEAKRKGELFAKRWELEMQDKHRSHTDAQDALRSLRQDPRMHQHDGKHRADG